MLDELQKRLWFALFCVAHRRSYASQRRWQLRYLRKLVKHAHENVPMWGELLGGLGENVQSVSLGDRRLPVTSKETYRGRPADAYIDNSRAHLMRWYNTSGSSGAPFTFLYGAHGTDAKYVDFASMRFLWWRNEPLESIYTTKLARVKIRAQPSAYRFFASVERYLKDPRGTLEALVRFDARIVSSYPSLLLDMARMVKDDPLLRIPHLRYIISFGENLTPAVRTCVEDAFGAEVYDRYGLEEIGAVGVECEKHDGFHINTESVLLEVLDAQGDPVAPGVSGRIVLTDLFNYAMPFIRYDSGDHGSICVEPCACGLRSPRLWVDGRHSSSIRIGGRLIHHLEFDGVMDGYMHEIMRYQIVKKSEDALLAKVVPATGFARSTSVAIEDSLRRLVGGNVQIVIEVVEKIVVTPRGKSQILVDETKAS